MKLGKLKQVLAMALAMGTLSSSIFGADYSKEATAVQHATSISEVEQSKLAEMVVDMQEANQEDAEVEFIKKYGEAVHVSTIKGNAKVTVEYVLADPYTVSLLFSVEKVDGTPFKVKDGIQVERVDLNSKQEIEQQKAYEALPENATLAERIKVMAQFNEEMKTFVKADGTVDEEGFITYFMSQMSQAWSTGTAGSSYGACYTKENTPSKQYFIYEGSSGNPMSQELVMSIQSIKQEEEKTSELAVNLVSYLTEHKEDALKTVPYTVDEHELKELEELKLTNEALYLSRKKELDENPKTLLAEQGLGLEVISGNDSFVIDNIGFIDGKLHMLMTGEGLNRYHVEVYDKQGEWVFASYNTGSSKRQEDGSQKYETYCVYDINSIEALKAYTFKTSSREVVETWQGPWEINFNLSKFPEAKVIEVNQMIPYTSEEQARLKEVSLMNCSMSITIDQIQSEIENNRMSVKLNLKDGSAKELEHVSATNRQKEQLILIYSLGDIVRDEVQSITIGNQEVKVI